MRRRWIAEETAACLACVTWGYLSASAVVGSWALIVRGESGLGAALVGLSVFLASLGLMDLKRFLRAAPLRSDHDTEDDGGGGDDDTHPMTMAPVLPLEADRMRCN